MKNLVDCLMVTSLIGFVCAIFGTLLYATAFAVTIDSIPNEYTSRFIQSFVAIFVSMFFIVISTLLHNIVVKREMEHRLSDYLKEIKEEEEKHYEP
jgi:uncharacterized membrane protein required for colicin V production